MMKLTATTMLLVYPVFPCIAQQILDTPMTEFDFGTMSGVKAGDSYFATYGPNGAFIWSIDDGRLLRTLQSFGSDVRSIDVSSNAELVVTGSREYVMRIWDVETGHMLHTYAHPGVGREGFTIVKFSEDDRMVLCVADHRELGYSQISIVDTETGIGVNTFDYIHPTTEDFGFFDFLAGSTKAVGVMRSQRRGVVLDLNSGVELQNWELSLDAFNSVALSPERTQLLCGDRNHTDLWDVSSEEIVHTFAEMDAESNVITSVAFSPTEPVIVTSAWNQGVGAGAHSISMWDVTTGHLLMSFADGGTGGIFAVSLSFSLDGTMMLARMRSRTAPGTVVRLWKRSSGEMSHDYEPHANRVSSRLLSPDGGNLLIGTTRGDIQVWSTETGDLLRSVKGHGGSVSSFDFSPDGTQIISGSADRTAKVWDFSTLENRVIFPEHVSELTDVQFAKNGTRALTTARSTLLWDISGISTTPTTTPLPGSTPTPTPVPFSIDNAEPEIVYDFDGSSAEENGLFVAAPGESGQFGLADVTFGTLGASGDAEDYSDGIGVTVVMDGGEGVIFYGDPITVEDDLIYMRISLRSYDAGSSSVVGAFDAAPSDELFQAELSGSMGINMLIDTNPELSSFRFLDSFYRPERGAIVPIFQVANHGTERVTVELDNFEIYRVPESTQ